MDKIEICPIKKLAIHMRYPIIIGVAIASYFSARAIVHLISHPSRLETTIQFSEPNDISLEHEIIKSKSYYD